jgi:hypothetical protein
MAATITESPAGKEPKTAASPSGRVKMVTSSRAVRRHSSAGVGDPIGGGGVLVITVAVAVGWGSVGVAGGGEAVEVSAIGSVGVAEGLSTVFVGGGNVGVLMAAVSAGMPAGVLVGVSRLGAASPSQPTKSRKSKKIRET